MRTSFPRRSLVVVLTVALLLPTAFVVARQVPAPEAVLGERPGADFFLASYDQALEYFQQLAAASDRVRLQQVGETSFGNPWYVALISAAENLADFERHREIAQRLAHPEGLTEQEARQLAAEGKAIVHIDSGLHATEVAHAQHAIQLAYDLVTGDDDPERAAILENVILVLWFSINPDGQNMVAEWYAQNVRTPYEIAPLPELYQKYIGHDNNRDGYMINMIESRVVTRWTRHFEPQILYNHHQSSPFPTRIWIPPFAEPVSTYVHPLMWRTVNFLGMSMAQALEERGQVGATHMGTGFDNWYPGFMDHANNFHNVASFLTETALAHWASPRLYTVRDFPDGSEDLRPESLYASPWKGGWWHLMDSVEYMLTASFSVLDFAAKYREDVLFNRYQAGRDVIAEYTENPPYAYFIPQEQRDPVAPVELLRRLAYNGIEVHQLDASVTHQGMTWPAGTWVIPMDQEFAHFVRQLFEVQEYPDLRQFPEGPPDQPYDVAGWTLPYQFDVRVVEATEPLGDDVRAALRSLEGEAVAWDSGADAAPFDSAPGPGFDVVPGAAGVQPPPGAATGSGPALVLDPAQNNTFPVLHAAWEAGGTVQFRPGEAGEAGEGGESGAWVVSGVDRATQDGWVETYALRAQRGEAGGTRVERPRVALFRPWGGNMDEGWTRWLLERYGFDPMTIRNADVRAGELGERFDVVVLADFGPRTLVEGRQEGTMPPRYTGGIGKEGIRNLEEFVRRGGTLLCINSSSMFAVEEFHLPVKNVVAGLDNEEYFLAGSILDLEVDPYHPAMAGMPRDARMTVGRGPVFTTEEGFEGAALAKYPENGSPLLSGYLLGEERLHGHAAALEVRHGDGHVLLMGLKPQWRAQPFGNFKILFNSVLFHGEVADEAEGSPDFWHAPPEEEEAQEPGDARGR